MFPFEKICRFYGLEDVNPPAVLSTCVGGSVAVVGLSVPPGSLDKSGIVEVRRNKIPDLIAQKNFIARFQMSTFIRQRS